MRNCRGKNKIQSIEDERQLIVCRPPSAGCYSTLRSTALFLCKHNGRLFCGAYASEEVAHLIVLLDRDSRCAKCKVSREDELVVFDFVGCGVGAKRSVELDGVWHFVNVEACGKLHAHSLRVGVGREYHRLLARRGC